MLTPTNTSDSCNQHDNSEEVTVEVHAPQDQLVSGHMTSKSGDGQESVCKSLCTTSFLGLICNITYLTDMYKMFVTFHFHL